MTGLVKPTGYAIQNAKFELADVAVAGEFVHRIAQGVERSWPEIRTLLGPLFGEAAACLDEPDAWLEFGLALMAIHIQALPDALVPSEAVRIRVLVLTYVCTTLGVVPRQTVERYERAWHDSITAGGAPLDCVARLLCDRWGISRSGPPVRVPGSDPHVVMVLGTALLTWADAWPHWLSP